MTDRIVHIISGLGIGGAERALFNLLNALSPEERASCNVVSLTSMGAYGPKIQSLGISVQALGLGATVKSFRSLLTLRHQWLREPPKVVMSWMYHANIVAWIVIRWLPEAPKLIWNIRHCLYTLKDEKPLTRVVIIAHKWMCKSVAAIIYNSQLSNKQHADFGIQSINSFTIPNGFNTAEWRPSDVDRNKLRDELGIPLSARVIGNIARYHPLKDHATLLRAMRWVMINNPNVHLLLLGRDVDAKNPQLTEYFDELPMNRVHVMGEQNDVYKLVPAMDIFCLSSRSEAFPNVLGEAMSSGVVCVTTDVGDAKLIVGEAGFVVPVSDHVTLATILLKIAEKDHFQIEYLGKQARSHILQNYSMERMVESYQKLLFGRP